MCIFTWENAQIPGGKDVSKSTHYESFRSQWVPKIQDHPDHRWHCQRGNPSTLTINSTSTTAVPNRISILELDAITWWLRNTPLFTQQYDTSGNRRSLMASHNECTYMELAIDIELVTRVGLGGVGASLAKKGKFGTCRTHANLPRR